MKTVRHTVACVVGECDAELTLEIAGAHDLRSVGQMHEDIAEIAGWRTSSGDHFCPGHARVAVGSTPCCCVQRTGIQHTNDCPLQKATPP